MSKGRKKRCPIFQNLLKIPEVYVYQRLLSNNLPLPVRSGLLSTTHIRTVSASTRALLVVLARLLLAKHRLNTAIPSWLLLQLMQLSCRPHCRQTCSRPQTNWLIYVDLIAGHPAVSSSNYDLCKHHSEDT